MVDGILSVLTTDELWPISSFLDQGACKNALLPQLDDGLEDTEATVQDDHIPLVEYGGKHLKQHSICGTYVVKFLLPKSSGMTLVLHKIYPPHDARGAATDGMILISKWPWFTGDKHEPRACEFVCPDTHAFV